MMTINSNTLKVVLWAAIEDYAPLWEIASEVEAHGSGAAGQPLTSPELIVHELLARGWVNLFWVIEPDGSPVPIPSSDLGAVLADEDAWLPRRLGSKVVTVSATEEGEREYERIARSQEA